MGARGSFGAAFASVALAYVVTLAGGACGSSATDEPAAPSDATRETSANADVDTSDGAPACSAHSFDWAIVSGGSALETHVTGVASDADGNTWLTGYFGGSVKWGDFALTAQGTATAFLVKLDVTGKIVLAKGITASNGSTAARVRTNAQGNVYIAGNFGGDLVAGATTLSAADAGPGQIFVAALDANANFLWARQSTGAPEHDLFGLDADADGNVYVSGLYMGATTTFGSVTLPDSGGVSVFAAKYTSSGDVAWARGWPTTVPSGGCEARAIAARSDGSAVIVGSLSGPIDFDGHMVASSLSSSRGAFVVAVDGAGKAIWAADGLPMNEVNDDVSYTSVATTPAGGVFLTGSISGTVSLGSTSLTSSSSTDMVLAMYGADGALAWARHAGRSNADAVGWDVVAGPSGVYVNGSKYGPALQFDSMTLDHTGVAFIASYDVSGAVQWVTGNDGPSQTLDDGESVAIARGPRGVVIGGMMKGRWSFGDATITNAPSTDHGGFVAHLCE